MKEIIVVILQIGKIILLMNMLQNIQMRIIAKEKIIDYIMIIL